MPALLIAAALLAALTGCRPSGPASEILDRASASAGSDCAAVKVEELAVPCWMEQGVASAERGDTGSARSACGALAPGVWRDECYFQSAEQLGLRGNVLQAVDLCGHAGRYHEYCLIHIAWWARDYARRPAPSDPETAARIEQWLAPIAAELQPSALGARGRAMLEASAWFEVYYGSGAADPAAAKAADSAAARTAFAFELARLRPDSEDLVAEALAIWSGEAPPVTGPALPPRCLAGRRPDVPHRSKARTPLVHGAWRIKGSTETADLTIAALEGRFFLETGSPEGFARWLDDERQPVRLTAARLLAGSADRGAPLAEQLRGHADPGVREIALEVWGSEAPVRWEMPRGDEDPDCD